MSLILGGSKQTLLDTEYTESELGEMRVFFNPSELMTQTSSGSCQKF